MHHFTVDVEEYFHANALEECYPFDSWERLPRRSPPIMDRVLSFLEERRIQGTFFVLGWLAEREPEMVRRIADAGHEIASHGWRHRLVTRLTPAEFRESVSRSKAVLEQIAGVPVKGYRAPSFSIVPGGEWAFDTLLEEGYAYDSSLMPVRWHPTYGYPGVQKAPHWIERPSGRILEVPLTTRRWAGQDLPLAGGAYFRFAPYGLVRRAFREVQEAGRPGTFYIHPWELDPKPPKLPTTRLTRFRTQWSNGDTWTKMGRLVSDFRFGRMDSLLGTGPAGSPGTP